MHQRRIGGSTIDGGLQRRFRGIVKRGSVNRALDLLGVEIRRIKRRADIGGGIACGETHDIVAVTIDSQFAPGPVCPDSGGSPNVVWQHTGRVVKSANNTFVMDTCPPNADCIQMFTTVTVKAEGLDLNIPVGTLVDVREELNKVWMVCSTQLSIRNVANWGGEQNPVWSNDNGWWLLATDRTATPPKESPLSVSVADIGCYLNTPGCGGAQAPGDYALLFDVGPGQPGVMVGMGQVEWIYNGIQDFMVRNQRSYQSGACDDYWNWSWWAMYAPLEAN